MHQIAKLSSLWTYLVILNEPEEASASSEYVFVANDQRELNHLLTKHKSALVFFHTRWARPSREIAPLFTWLADEYTLRQYLVFISVDIDKAPDIQKRYRITEIPTFVVFEDGRPGQVKVPSTHLRPESKVQLATSGGALVERVFGSLEFVVLLDVVKALNEAAWAKSNAVIDERLAARARSTLYGGHYGVKAGTTSSSTGRLHPKLPKVKLAKAAAKAGSFASDPALYAPYEYTGEDGQTYS